MTDINKLKSPLNIALRASTIFITASSVAGALLLILPMPTSWLWFLAAGLNEETVWLLLAASLGCVLCGITIKRDKWKPAFFCTGLCAIVILYVIGLTVQVFDVARGYQSQLSFPEYILGAPAVSTPITETRDISITPEKGVSLLLDVYKSSSEKKLTPAIVILHGGSWRRGHKSDFARVDRWLAEKHYTVFDINYRLARPGCEFPAQLNDVIGTINWIYKNAEKYGADKNKIGILGRSAGAQLALEAGYNRQLTPSDAASLKENPGKTNKPAIGCVVSYYAPTNLSWDYTHPCIPDVIDTHGTLENYLGGIPSERAKLYSAASPVEQVSPECPPTMILQGGRDQVVRIENAEQLIRRLTTAKVPFSYVYLPWANHGFDYRFSGWSSQISRPMVLKFLDKYLKQG